MSVKVDRYRADLGEDGPCPPKTRKVKPLEDDTDTEVRRVAEPPKSALKSALRKANTNSSLHADGGTTDVKPALRKNYTNTSLPDVGVKPALKSSLKKKDAREDVETVAPIQPVTPKLPEPTTPKSALRKRPVQERPVQETIQEPAPPKPCLKPALKPASALKNKADQINVSTRADQADGVDNATPSSPSAPPKRQTPSSENTPKKHLLSSENISAHQAAQSNEPRSSLLVPSPVVERRESMQSEFWDGESKEDSSDDDDRGDEKQTPMCPTRSRQCIMGVQASAQSQVDESLKCLHDPVDMKDNRPEIWTVTHICRRAYYQASQRDAWKVHGSVDLTDEVSVLGENGQTRKSMTGARGRRMSHSHSVFAVDFKLLEERRKSAEESQAEIPAATLGVLKKQRGTAVLILDDDEEVKPLGLESTTVEAETPKPVGDTGAPRVMDGASNDKALADTGGTPVGQVSPLKEVLTAKKVNADQVKAVLESMSPHDLELWIDTPLGVASAPLPTPLFFAVGATLPAVVGLLLEYTADVRKQYNGQKMYNGWIKPGASPIEAVTARRGRFVGTMLGDRLDETLEILKIADAKWQKCADDKADAARQAELREEIENRIDKITKKDPMSEGRKSIKLAAARGTVEHTQGHPSEKYDVIREIGDGHYATVKEARFRKTGEMRAIKALMKVEEGLVWEEITIIRKLYHPNVIQLFESFEDDSNIFVVLELCSGGELFDRLASQGGIPEHAAARIMQQLASAVKYIHDENVCHRDVKPESFLLKDPSDLNEACVKLIDFATAKEFGPGIEMRTKICTLHYVAPEILSRKSIPYTEKIDVWSVGVVFFMILSGCPPFHAESELDTLKRIKKGNFKFNPPDVWSHVSKNAKDLISKMLVVDPLNRYSSTEVASHGWLSEATTSIRSDATSKAHNNLMTAEQLNHLRNFHARNRVQKVVQRLRNHKLSDEAVEELRSVFKNLDHDGTGEVHISHIRDKIRRIPAVNDNMEEIMRVLWSLEGGTGKVQFDKFLKAMVERHTAVQKEACRAVFDVFDFDASGKISKDELKLALGVDKGDGSSFWNGVETVLGLKAIDIESKFSSLCDSQEFSFDEFFEILQTQV